jgi:transcription elongation factor GreA
VANKRLTYEMTREEFQALKKELDVLKTTKREEISEKIRIARGFGDLSENSEYDEAKNDQAHLEARISRIEDQLKNVVIVDQIDTDRVAVGTKVTLLDMDYGDKAEYRIVSSVGAGDEMNTITTSSPVGRAILGRKVGDEVMAHAPAGEIRFKVVGISK